jgi:hypothetical protein
MTSDETNTGARAENRAPVTTPVAAPGRRFPTGALVGAGLVGLVIGAIAAFAVTGLVWTVRVELPPPPYPPQLSSAPTPGCLSPPPAAPGTAPPGSAGVVPMPPVPPLPHALRPPSPFPGGPPAPPQPPPPGPPGI